MHWSVVTLSCNLIMLPMYGPWYTLVHSPTWRDPTSNPTWSFQIRVSERFRYRFQHMKNILCGCVCPSFPLTPTVSFLTNHSRSGYLGSLQRLQSQATSAFGWWFRAPKIQRTHPPEGPKGGWTYALKIAGDTHRIYRYLVSIQNGYLYLFVWIKHEWQVLMWHDDSRHDHTKSYLPAVTWFFCHIVHVNSSVCHLHYKTKP